MTCCRSDQSDHARRHCTVALEVEAAPSEFLSTLLFPKLGKMWKRSGEFRGLRVGHSLVQRAKKCTAQRCQVLSTSAPLELQVMGNCLVIILTAAATL